MRGLFLGLSTIALSSSSSFALHFTTESECAALCSDGSNSTTSNPQTSTTNSTDVVCEDNEYSSSGNGIRFKNCLNCLQKSDTTWKEQSDVYWFLYNVRYAFDVCLYSYPDAADSGTINSPCNIESSCGSLEDALTASLLKTTPDNQFDYCEAENSVIKSSSYSQCIGCLQSTSNQKYLANFLVALKAGCIQEPKKGDILGLSGTIFTHTLINITDPNTNQTLPGDDGAPVGSMTTGTIVGIAVGCGLGIAGMVWLIFMYCRRSRQRRGAGVKIESPPPDAPMNDPSMYGIHKSSYFTDNAGYPGRSAQPHNHAGNHIRTMSNAEYYDSFEQDSSGINGKVSYHYAPHSKSNGPNAALPAHPAYIPRVVSRLPDAKAPSSLRHTMRSNVPDSYALQTYLSAAEPAGTDTQRIGEVASLSTSSSRVASRDPSPVPHHPATRPPISAAAPVPAPEAVKTKPSFAFPSLSKLIIPKKQGTPQLNLLSATPISAIDNDPRHELRISRPLAVLDPRFQDRPLGGGIVLATEVPAGFSDDYLKRREANKSPMLSGNSRVYG
ncbi:exo-alpha-sialidase neuraminidase [Fusarium tjaetaba]|uniref:Exo-alpha-sialidase neuraminidase n=1 Tax=Fusarium tjaetaba TaxID=1567544 RepID=A0A8H5RCR7_9HYPO|nr:exo-alpha-sialidase neuraminidase [Fusarium tjaetaba]KAF5630690.1 exo-alpha-sialidase neuraminidase [Fusarium tjaetaba]